MDLNWHKNKATQNWECEHEGNKLRIQRSKWGNSDILAWEIFINGESHGKELGLSSAKQEARRCLNTVISRASF